ncbi:caspase family protein [Gammaproteobacteria bacterium]|nr:caspase family protein [Gammaproteobacteria bacterium]
MTNPYPVMHENRNYLLLVLALIGAMTCGSVSLVQSAELASPDEVCTFWDIPQRYCISSSDAIESMANAGDADAQLLFALRLESKIADFKNEDEAEPEAYLKELQSLANRWFKSAADQGKVSAKYALGYNHRWGIGVEKDEKFAFETLLFAAESGFAPSYVLVADSYQWGIGTKKNPEMAFNFYKKAADREENCPDRTCGRQGSGLIKYKLGRCYMLGFGTDVNYELAAKWFEAAAYAGVVQGEYDWAFDWAMMLKKGDLVEQDSVAALKWMTKAAHGGLPEAQVWLGLSYSNGEGVIKDEAKAIEWYLKAAKQEDDFAQNNLGWAYEHGEGVEIDPIEAVRWYKSAVAQGNNLAQFNLGFIYERGWGGTQQNFSKAIDLYEKASDQGNEEALFKLASIYKNGFGIKRDLAKARKLYSKLLDGDFEDYRVSTDSKSLRGLAKLELAKIDQLVDYEGRELLAKLKGGGEFHALIIGNDKYEHLEDLTTPVKDARRLGSVLNRRFGYEVQLLENATRAETLRALNSYRRKLSKEDNLLVYYAGHGIEDGATRIGYWQPVDAIPGEFFTAIKSDSITDEIGALKANNVIVVADSCYAGAMVAYRGSPNPLDVGQEDRFTYLQRLHDKKTRLVFTSGGVEPVVDVLGESENSIFAEILIGILESTDDALTATDLYQRVREGVIPKAAGFSNQTPQLSRLVAAGDAQNGDFLFLPLVSPEGD